jgi:hypothetical protein
MWEHISEENIQRIHGGKTVMEENVWINWFEGSREETE